MKRLCLPLVLLLSLAVAQASPFSEAFESWKMVDGAGQHADFVKFRSELLGVVERRDAAALKSYLSPQIQYSFGLDKPGPAGFYARWRPGQADCELWKELGQVLRNGGSFDNRGMFTAPAWYASWPAGRDEMEWGVVSDAAVKVYSEARADSRTLPEIGPCWVHISQNPASQNQEAFTCIDLPKSMQDPYKVESAFVARDQVHRLLGYRAVFARRQGRWQMLSFLSGD